MSLATYELAAGEVLDLDDAQVLSDRGIRPLLRGDQPGIEPQRVSGLYASTRSVGGRVSVGGVTTIPTGVLGSLEP
jgi:hypothetical protein